MFDPFDIFKVEQNGSVRWVRAIADLQRAKSHVLKVLSIATPANHIILNQWSGERIIIKAAIEQCDLRLKVPSSTASSRS